MHHKILSLHRNTIYLSSAPSPCHRCRVWDYIAALQKALFTHETHISFSLTHSFIITSLVFLSVFTHSLSIPVLSGLNHCHIIVLYLQVRLG